LPNFALFRPSDYVPLMPKGLCPPNAQAKMSPFMGFIFSRADG
jgi:hypothetical protein